MNKYFFDAPQIIHPERLRTLKFLEDNNYKRKEVIDIGDNEWIKKLYHTQQHLMNSL